MNFYRNWFRLINKYSKIHKVEKMSCGKMFFFFKLSITLEACLTILPMTELDSL